jgi:uncharacterized repeat protein (TIGR01451 family)
MDGGTMKAKTITGYEPRFDVDLKRGKVGEDKVLDTIDAINDGNRPLPQIVLSDPLPNATRFVAARAEASFPGTVLYAVDQQPFSDQPPTSVRSGQAVSVAVRTHSPAGGFGELDTVPPGGRVTLRLVVSVR